MEKVVYSHLFHSCEKIFQRDKIYALFLFFLELIIVSFFFSSIGIMTFEIYLFLFSGYAFAIVEKEPHYDHEY